MKTHCMRNIMTTALVGLLGARAATGQKADPLPSWNNGPTKLAIVDLVSRVTMPGGRDFLPGPERIAVFDNDGALWAEHPSSFELDFALDRVIALAPKHPEWRTAEPFASLLKGDVGSALAGGQKDILKIVTATNADMTKEERKRVVSGWVAAERFATAPTPNSGMFYRPMLELLAYLRANGFKTYIGSGGRDNRAPAHGAEFDGRGAIIHIQIATLFNQALRDSSPTETERQ